MSYGGGQKVQKVMVQPINLIFRYLQNRTKVSVWLYENVNTRYILCFTRLSDILLTYTQRASINGCVHFRGILASIFKIAFKAFH